jgi:acetoin utilization deacetylase AcuC-like enzyme
VSLTIISSDRFAEHRTPPGHPERVERAEVMNGVASQAPHPASTEQLARVHAPEYIARMADTAGRAVALDSDTYTSAESHGVALLAAGAAVDAVKLVMNPERSKGRSGVNAALAMVRPPGHHAERARAMGFCLFNNVAVAARYALDRLGVGRVLVLDWDVHHGNGTNDIFYESAEVLYVSIHQSPLYPGTGALTDSGAGAGEGHTVNLPVPPGAGHADWLGLVQQIVAPIARAYAPGLLLVSAGFDAHRDDPLADCMLTEESYAAMAAAMRMLSRDLGAPLGFVLEGGYDLEALAASVAATIEGALDAPAADPVEPGPLVTCARDHYSRWWPLR